MICKLALHAPGVRLGDVARERGLVGAPLQGLPVAVHKGALPLLRLPQESEPARDQREHDTGDQRGANDHATPNMQRWYSAVLRRTRPRITRPPALFHQVSASQPPATSPALRRRVAVDFPAAPIPALYASEV